MKIKECGPRGGGGASLAQPAPSGSANLCGFRACSHERCNYRQQRSCGQGNIFTPVCHSFCSQGGSAWSWGGGGIPACSEADPPTPHTPGRPPRTRQTPPEADSSIRSTSGRYASYWNAFMFSESVTELLLPFFCRIHLSQQQIPREMCQINVWLVAVIPCT